MKLQTLLILLSLTHTMYCQGQDRLTITKLPILNGTQWLRINWNSSTPNQSYRLETSTNLVHWKNEGMVQAKGEAQFLSTRNGDVQFFRLIPTIATAPPPPISTTPPPPITITNTPPVVAAPAPPAVASPPPVATAANARPVFGYSSTPKPGQPSFGYP